MEFLIFTFFFLCVTCEEKVNNTGRLDRNLTLTKSNTSVTTTLDQNTTTKCDINITDIHNKVITDIATVCGPNQPCVTKCCGFNELLYVAKENGIVVKYCLHFDKLKTIVNVTESVLDYSDYAVIDKDIYKKGPVRTKKNIMKDFTIIVNKQPINKGCGTKISKLLYYLLEDGRFVVLQPNAYHMWKEIKSSRYCIEKIVSRRFPQGIYYHFLTIYDESKQENDDDRNMFSGVAMVISAFFLLLVLLVYSVLKELRNIHGMVVMAYVATLAIGYLFKAAIHFAAINNTLDGYKCQQLSPVCYIFILSSFFWLNIMSFDMWWTFRAFRKVRRIHRQGELKKFTWYGVYAWGVPTLLGVGAYCVDSVIDMTSIPTFVTPHFQSCFQNHAETMLYLHVPILIMTIFNTSLSIMTIYNMWLVNDGIAYFDNSRKITNQNNRYRFCLYFRISALMGVSWIVELLNQISTSRYDNWLFISLNICNMLIGVVIFFMLVCKPLIFTQLRQRFNNIFSKSRNVISTRSAKCSRSSKSSRKTKEFDTSVDLNETKTEVTKPNFVE